MMVYCSTRPRFCSILNESLYFLPSEYLVQLNVHCAIALTGCIFEADAA